jgi:hypothetical protein
MESITEPLEKSMSSVNKAESPEHKRMVKGLIDYLNKQGFQTVCAAYEGLNQCEPIDERIPDCMGKNVQGLLAIAEAKTCDDLVNDRKRTDDQFKTFSNREMSSGISKGQAVPFYICVPKECNEQLNQILRELGLSGKPNITTLQYG